VQGWQQTYKKKKPELISKASKIREVCAAAGKPDGCIAIGDEIYDICIPCVDNPSGLDGTGVSCTDPGPTPMAQGLAGFEGYLSCNDL